MRGARGVARSRGGVARNLGSQRVARGGRGARVAAGCGGLRGVVGGLRAAPLAVGCLDAPSAGGEKTVVWNVIRTHRSRNTCNVKAVETRST